MAASNGSGAEALVVNGRAKEDTAKIELNGSGAAVPFKDLQREAISGASLGGQLFEKEGRNREFQSAVLNYNGQRIETKPDDLKRIEGACVRAYRYATGQGASAHGNAPAVLLNGADQLAAGDPELKRSLRGRIGAAWDYLTDAGADPWRKALLGSEFTFASASLFASVKGAQFVPGYNPFNVLLAVGFSATALGLVNIAARNAKRRKDGEDLSRSKIWGPAAGFVAAAAMPFAGTYIFLEKAYMDSDGTREAGSELAIWEKERAALVERVDQAKGDLERNAPENSTIASMETELAAALGRMSEATPPFEYQEFVPPDKPGSLLALESQYEDQLERLALEGDTGMKSGYQAKAGVAEELRLKLEAGQKDYEEGPLASARAAYEAAKAKAEEKHVAGVASQRQGAVDLLRQQLQEEKMSAQALEQLFKEGPYAQRLQELEQQLAQHEDLRGQLERSVFSQEEDRAMLHRIAQERNIPLNRLLIALTFAIEGATYLAAYGVHMAEGRRRRGDQEPVSLADTLAPGQGPTGPLGKGTPGQISAITAPVQFGDNVHVMLREEQSEARLVRTHREGGQEVRQEMTVEVSDLPDIAATAADLYEMSNEPD